MTDREDFTSRLRRLVGDGGVSALSSTCVMVLGLGGVGSSCVEALARGGIGSFVLVDCDVVQESNINRQAIAFRSTVGQRKVDVMAAMIADINPEARVEVRHEFLTAETAAACVDEFADRVDFVVDAIDTVSAKLAVAKYAFDAGIPLVSSMGAANKLRPELFGFADLFETSACPLCRAMRKGARKQGIGALRVLYSREEPYCVSVPTVAEPELATDGVGVRVAVLEGAVAERNGESSSESAVESAAKACLGTMSYAPPIMGQMLAGDVIREVLGFNGADSWAQACRNRAVQKSE